MVARLAKVEFIVVDPNWPLVIGALLAALLVAALVCWFVVKTRK